MWRSFLAAAAVLAGGLALVAAPAPDQAVTYIDLQPKANQKLKDLFHSNTEGNNLASLPTGEQKLEGVKFKIGEGLIQLGSKVVQDRPEKVEGIKVDRTFTTLHILHATGYGGGPNQPGTAGFVEDDTLIGKYIVNYEDKTKQEIEIVYGKDVRDWFYAEGEADVSRGKVAWKGENERAKALNCGLRLYLSTWKNPKPDKKVVSIDYISTGDTAAAPFCVAMTAETK
jgi:hypothetical protein